VTRRGRIVLRILLVLLVIALAAAGYGLWWIADLIGSTSK